MAQTTDNTGGTPPAPKYSPPPQTTNVGLHAFREVQAAGGQVNANPAARKFDYWEDPKRVVRYKTFVDSQAPGWQPPEWLNVQDLNAAYEYLKFRNNDRPWREWKALAPDDPGTSFLQSIPKPPPAFQPAYDRDWSTLQPPEPVEPTDAFGAWDQLTPWQQLTLGLFDPQPGLAGRPEWTRYTAALGQGALAIPGGFGIGAGIGSLVAPGPGTVVGGLIGGGLALAGTTAQGIYGQPIPGVTQMLQLFDLPSNAARRLWGLGTQISNEGWEPVVSNLPAAWAAADLKYRTLNQDLLNIVARAAGDQPAGPGEVWQIQRGISEPQALAAGRFGVVRGAEALREARVRIEEGEDPQLVYVDFIERFGFTGTFNDFVLSTLIDPSNFLPAAGTKLGEGVARAVGNQRLAAAFQMSQGNLIADAVPFAGPAIARALGFADARPTGGVMDSLALYGDWVRRGTAPAGVDVTPAGQLSWFDRAVARLTPEGRYRDVEPTAPTGNRVLDWFTYLTELTPEAKAHTFLSLFHDNVNVLLNMANSDPARMVQLLEQAASARPVEVGQLGEAILNSPATATIAQALRDALSEGWHKELLLRYTEAQPKRQLLEKIATALQQTPADVIERAVANPQDVVTAVAQAGGPTVDVATIQNITGVFTGPNALPLNENQFQAQLALTVFDKLDDWLVQRYGIQPDAAVFRLSKTLKGMQSLLLLGFNPSYFVNNAVNNVATRAATGIFGYMTPRQIEAFLDRFGVKPQRLEDALAPDGQPRAGTKIDAARRGEDWIAGVNKVVNATNNKLGIFSRFSSAHEQLESRSIYTIAMQKYWGKAWKPDKGFRRMHPTVEAYLDRQYPGVKEQIYSAVQAGMNMQEIEARIYGQAIQPEVGTIIDQVAREMFPDLPDAGTELLKAHGIQAALERYLATSATPDEAFTRVRADLQRITNEAHARDVAARPTDVANKVQAEGAPAILEALLQVNTRADRRQTSDPQAFTRLDEYARATWGGILKAIGTDHPLTQAVLDQRQAWSIYASQRRQAVKKYQQSLKRKRGETFNAYTARINGAKAELDARLVELYADYSAAAQRTRTRIEQQVQPESAAAPQASADAGAAAPDPRITALNQLARANNLVDGQGRPVLRYLLNIYNRAVPADQRVRDVTQMDLERAAEVMEAHRARYALDNEDRRAALVKVVNEIIQQTDDAAREADLLARGLTTRRLVREQLVEAFKVDDAQVDAALALLDAHADQVARAQGVTPTAATRDGWYATRIARAMSDSDPADVYNNIYQEAYGTLFAMHNTEESALWEADELGGLPAPSIAVMKRGTGTEALESYGSVSLIARRQTIDPRADRRNRVFSADIASPTRPRQVWKKVKSSLAQQLVNRFYAAEKITGDYFTAQLWDYLVNTPDRNKAVELYGYNHAAPMYVYLQDKGITPPAPVQRTKALSFDWSERPQLVEFFTQHAEELEKFYNYRSAESDAVARQLADVVRQVVMEYYAEKFPDNPNLARFTMNNLRLVGPDGLVPFGTYDRMRMDQLKRSQVEIDRRATESQLRAAIKERGLEKDYLAWTVNQLDEVFEPPLIKLGGRLVPMTLGNIVEAMTSRSPRATEEGVPFGPGKVKAMVAKEFESVDQMHQAEGEITDTFTYEQQKAANAAIWQKYQQDLIDNSDYVYGNTDTWSQLDDAMHALAYYLKGGRKRSRARMRSALERAGFTNVPDDVVATAIRAAETIANTPTEYFEAKPQRPVYFDEFAGAVIPEDADPRTIEVLERRGIPYRTYARGNESARERAIAEFYSSENVLFQAMSASKARDVMTAILEAGFVPASAVRAWFMDVENPRLGPAYVRGLVRYIMEKRQKYDRGELTVRDVAKAYLATVSSQGSDAREWSTVVRAAKRAGLKLERDGQPIDPALFANYETYNQAGRQVTKLVIRPEEFAALWMWTDEGRATLDKLENGQIDVEAWKKYVRARAPFGRFGRGVQYKKVYGTNPKTGKKGWITWIDPDTGKPQPLEYDGQWFIERPSSSKSTKKNLQDIFEITQRINEAKGDTAKIEAAITELMGVSDGKAYFVGHMLGFGTGTVVDTQQANFWRDRAREAGYPERDLDAFEWGNWGKIVPEIKAAIEDVYWQLRDQYDIGADIPAEAFVYTMHHWLWSVAKGARGDRGPQHQGLYMALELAQGNKGGVSFLDDGRAIIRAYNAGDISTLVHEIGHIFRRDLDESDMAAYAQLAGMNVNQLLDLQGRFDRGEIIQGDPEYQQLIEAEEMFARGWERYLAEGDAPTPELRTVFEKFTDWMLRIYQQLRATINRTFTGRDVTGFESAPEFQVGGRTVSLTQSVTLPDGSTTTLRDIFDRLLTERRHLEDLDPYEPPTPEPTPDNPALTAVLEQPVKELPPAVQAAMAETAQRLLNELESSRSYLRSYTDVEGGAEVTKYTREWEGPLWYRQILDAAIKAGQPTDNIKDQYRRQLQGIINGRERGTAAVAREVKQLVVDMAVGTNPDYAFMQPAMLRYLGMNDELFSQYGDMILSSEWDALERMFGSEYRQVVDDALMWFADNEQQPYDPFTTDIEGNEPQPIPTPEQLADVPIMEPAVPVPELAGQVDLFGNPVDQFRLEAQAAEAEQFAPAAQGQQDALFDRREYLRTIQAREGGEFTPPPATADQPTLFQPQPNGSVPAGGTPTPEPWGAILDESLVEQLLPMLEQIEQRYLAASTQRPVALADMDTRSQDEVRRYINQVQSDMASTKYAAMAYGERMRDMTLLNYNRRYGLDNFIELFVPYQFWYTRSMIEWARRMIDRPSWFALYARMQETQEEMAQHMPARLRGKMRLPAPWLPEWAAAGLFFDPVGKFLPFATFGQPVARWAENRNQVEMRAEQVLGELVQNDVITQAEAEAALETRSGPAWSKAMAAAGAELDQGAGPENLLSMMLTPALWWTVGSNLLKGTPGKISTLPITRTGAAIETATRGTALAGLGKIAGLAAWPERQLRKAAGLSEFGEWGDYYVDRQLANMAADGTITADQARLAMIERAGPAYEQAYQRVAFEQAMIVPGAGVLNQLASGNLIGTLQALPTMIFGGTLFPDGELRLRNLKDDFSRAYQAYARGDREALDTFFKQYPEYEARLALYDAPEERLKQFLISEVWDRYTELERPNRSLAINQLGDKFERAFINKETRSYDSITVQELARWSQMLGGLLPDVDATSALIENPEPPVEFYPPALAAQIEEYQDERRKRYPNYYAIQSAYFSIPETDRKGRREFIKRFPQLAEYWDWKREYEKNHPEMAPYFEAGRNAAAGGQGQQQRASGPRLSDKELAQVDAVLLRQVAAWRLTGAPLTSGAYQELSRLAEARGIADPEEYAQLILATVLGQ